MKTWKALQKLSPTFVSSPANSLWVNGYLMLIKLSLCSHPSYRRKKGAPPYQILSILPGNKSSITRWISPAENKKLVILLLNFYHDHCEWSPTLLTIVQSILLCNVIFYGFIFNAGTNSNHMWTRTLIHKASIHVHCNAFGVVKVIGSITITAVTDFAEFTMTMLYRTPGGLKNFKAV